MPFEPIDEEAYGRITNPERYMPVVESARAIVELLVDRHVATATAEHPTPDPDQRVSVVERIVVRSPEPGSAELRFEITDFPGVYLHVGQLSRFDLPRCGCDACDEQPTELERQLAAIVDAVEMAGRRGVPVIAVTDSLAAPIVPYACHAFVVPNDSPLPFSSNVAATALLETLLAFVVADAPDDVVSAIDEFHANRRAAGIYID